MGLLKYMGNAAVAVDRSWTTWSRANRIRGMQRTSP